MALITQPGIDAPSAKRLDETGRLVVGYNQLTETGEFAVGVLTEAGRFIEGVPIAREVLAAATAQFGDWYVTSFDQNTAEDDGFWSCGAIESTTTLDVTPAFFPPAAGVADEVQAAQAYGDDPNAHDDGPGDPWWGNVYGFPDQVMDIAPQLAPPEASLETHAAQPHYGDDYATYIPAETEDYQPPTEQNEWLAPPEAPLETFAAQPTFTEHDFDTLTPLETDDYTPRPEQLEFLAPPEAIVPELLAAQPHFGEYDWPADETDDYSNDSSLDVTPAFFPPIVTEPVETFAAQPHYGEWDWQGEELEDYQAFTDQLEYLAPPEAPLAEIQVAQPTFGEWHFIPEETEDYANDTSLEVPAPLMPVADAELAAAQPHYGEWWWEDEPTQDYANDSSLELGWSLIPPEAPLAEIQAAQPLPEQPWPAPEETDDYANDSAIEVPASLIPAPAANTDAEYMAAQPTFGGDIEIFWPADVLEEATWDALTSLEVPAALLPIPTDAVLIAAQPLGEQPWFEPPELEDYATDVPADISWFLTTPPLGVEIVIGAQPAPLDFFTPEETEDYQNDSSLELAWSLIPPGASLVVLTITQPLPELLVEWEDRPALTIEADSFYSLDTAPQLFPPIAEAHRGSAEVSDAPIGRAGAGVLPHEQGGALVAPTERAHVSSRKLGRGEGKAGP